jgi:drug/metabolite transporter (DMT)-like permease
MRAAVPVSRSVPSSVPSFSIPLPLLVAAFCLIWSSAFAVSKVALLDCPPLLLVMARCLFAGSIMLGAARIIDSQQKLARRDLAIYAALGIANYALYLGLGYVGITLGVSAGLWALISSANPILTAVLAAMLLDEPLNARKIAGLLLGILGVGVIVESRMSGGESLIGIPFSIAALVALVGGTMVFKRFTPGGSLVLSNGVQNLAGGLALAPFALTLESIADVTPSARLIASFLFLALMSSIVAYMLWFHLLKVAGASTASAYHFLMPPLGLFFGWLLLGERTEPFDLLGVVPVALGIWLVTHARTPQPGATA